MSLDPSLISAARAGDADAFGRLIEPHRREMKAHCYRLSGSWHDAEDLLQESLIRAWRGIGGFEGRSSVRTWLYAVTTHACLDALERRGPRLLPTDLGPAADPSEPVAPPSGEIAWLEPHPGDPDDASPEARLSAHESVAFAFLTVLQRLPPRQRAILLLRDVLGWQASECAELLGTSVASVNSALQRARETLDRDDDSGPAPPPAPESEAEKRLLARYVHAWEQAEVASLVELLREDALLSMPPFSAWFRGAVAIGSSLSQMVLPPEARGRFRLLATRANGRPAFGAYQLDEATGEWLPSAIHVLEILHVDGPRIAAITAFLSPALFASFGLPASLRP